jgi:hypothetical protein
VELVKTVVNDQLHSLVSTQEAGWDPQLVGMLWGR